MVDPSEAEQIIRALQTVKLRPTLTFCLVVVDLEDGTLLATAPEGINKKAILESAAKHYKQGPHAEFDIPPVS